MSKAQISIFIILATLIAVLIIISLSISYQPIYQPLTEDITVQIRSFTEDCLEQTLSDGLLILGMQGGYVYASDFPGYIPYSQFYVMLDDNSGFDFLPSTKEIATLQLAPYIQKQIGDCTHHYAAFEHARRRFEIGNATVSVIIGKDAVSAILHQPIRVSDSSRSFVIDDFGTSIPLHLPSMLATAEYLIQQHIRDPSYISLTTLEDLPFEPQVLTLYDDTYFVTLLDNSVSVRGKPYQFMWATQLSS
ncbi:MAG: hypothetical protein AABX52_04440, partial [Nanoarchaeota archaeon]